MTQMGYNNFNYCVRTTHGDCLPGLWDVAEMFENCAAKGIPPDIVG